MKSIFVLCNNLKIASLISEIKVLEQKRDKLEGVVKSYTKYREFLGDVLKESEDFSEIPDFIHRYDALTANLEASEINFASC